MHTEPESHFKETQKTQTLSLSLLCSVCMKMANISVNHFTCPVCWNLLKDPVTIPCGRSFCKVCINGCWDQEDVKGVYSCPQCRETFTPRPVLRRNNMLAEVVEKLKKTERHAASPAHVPGDVECDFCIGRKHKAVKTCLVCLASYCEDHLQPHYQSPAFKKHKLVEACAELQEKICSEHDKLIEIYCRTDQSFICYLCTMDQHRGHDTVAAKAERTEKQSFPSLCVPPGCEDSPSITVNQHLSFDGVRKSLSDLKIQAEEIYEEEFNKIRPQAAAVKMISPSEPKSREDFLQYFCYLTLDHNTAYPELILCEKDRTVTRTGLQQRYSDHPERFDSRTQVLCKESVCGRCYWEVEWSGDGVSISVSYKEISRKGQGHECLFGFNSQSWSLECTSSSVTFRHDKIETVLRVPSSSRIGVYVDHSAGTLSFYSVSDTMRLLHRVHTTFTKPLYAGFWMWTSNSTVSLCDPK
ncbi:E3 ubiquitin/ISG15 ligase TRIM25-like [Pangasianodon hypophthalmus]|uniref:E3 ubiquitin/ISG15 ligase TRIM25-like n=1 Tax=Pangasianodon hypophthalmus TaxID=310915 RepID=UPI0023080BE2|nr:E3 ubiquitin/ISG15 ligase TRIM25-like [Pangasianodon hypophthalmus]